MKFDILLLCFASSVATAAAMSTAHRAPLPLAAQHTPPVEQLSQEGTNREEDLSRQYHLATIAISKAHQSASLNIVVGLLKMHEASALRESSAALVATISLLDSCGIAKPKDAQQATVRYVVGVLSRSFERDLGYHALLRDLDVSPDDEDVVSAGQALAIQLAIDAENFTEVERKKQGSAWRAYWDAQSPTGELTSYAKLVWREARAEAADRYGVTIDEIPEFEVYFSRSN